MPRPGPRRQHRALIVHRGGAVKVIDRGQPSVGLPLAFEKRQKLVYKELGRPGFSEPEPVQGQPEGEPHRLPAETGVFARRRT